MNTQRHALIHIWHCRVRVSSCNIYVVQQDTHCASCWTTYILPILISLQLENLLPYNYLHLSSHQLTVLFVRFEVLTIKKTNLSGCDAVSFGRKVSTFRGNQLPVYSWLEVVHLSTKLHSHTPQITLYTGSNITPFYTQGLPKKMMAQITHSAELNGDSTCSSRALKFRNKTYRSIPILPSNLCNDHSRSIFPSSDPATILNALLLHLMHATHLF